MGRPTPTEGAYTREQGGRAMAGTVRHRSLFAIVDVGVVATTSWLWRRTAVSHLVPGAHTCPPQRGSVTPQWRWPTRSTPSGVPRGPAEGEGPVCSPSARLLLMPRASWHQGAAAGMSLLAAHVVGRTVNGTIDRVVLPTAPLGVRLGAPGRSPASDSAWTVCPSPIDEPNVVLRPPSARSRSARWQEPHSVGSSTRAPWVCVTRCRRGPH